jgi:flagellar biosynthesis/type III secretory pathway protein FliH
MSKIIKSKDTPNSECPIEAVEYIPLKEELSSFASVEAIAELKQRMERDERSFALCSMLYALRFLEAAEVREKALQAGYAEAKEEAAKEMQKMVNSQITLHNALEKCLQELASLKDSILDQAEGDIVQLAIAIAKKLVCRELKQHPDTIAAVVREAIKAARSGDEIKIRMHPDDCSTLEQYMGELKQSLEDIGRDNVSIRIEEAPELTPGGCVVETDINLIDMSLEERMESLFSMLDTR